MKKRKKLDILKNRIDRLHELSKEIDLLWDELFAIKVTKAESKAIKAYIADRLFKLKYYKIVQEVQNSLVKMMKELS